MTWAIDLGTTNSAVARWESGPDRPQLVELPGIARLARHEDPLETPRLVPSAVEVIGDLDWISRLGAWRPMQHLAFLGKVAHVGRPAIERNATMPRASFVPSFKTHLGQSSLRAIARANGHTFTARDVARMFLRELLAEVTRVTGSRPRDVVMTVPVDAFETFRAELRTLLKSAGVRRVRFVDEPVAAALGYGLGLVDDRVTLVVDIGGGTMHVALLRLTAHRTEAGSARVIAKEVRRLGGEIVDGWLLAEALRRIDASIPDTRDDDDAMFWRRAMIAEACRVKEDLHFSEVATFEVMPPESLRRLDARFRGTAPIVQVTREELVALLRQRGWYAELAACVDRVLEAGREQGIPPDAVSDVLMVGGSTLLPDVYPYFETRFGRDRVRAWHPFEAVAHGACAYAADRLAPADFIVHDYAFRTHDPKTHEPKHVVVIPRGTRFPTPPDLWRGRLVPTCSLGEPESMFKLVICEMARGDATDRQFAWDARGQLAKLGGSTPQNEIIVPLNEANPTLGTLDPPHSPRDKRPRLDISFGVNADRWLCTSVRDILTGRLLMEEEPVVRVL